MQPNDTDSIRGSEATARPANITLADRPATMHRSITDTRARSQTDRWAESLADSRTTMPAPTRRPRRALAVLPGLIAAAAIMASAPAQAQQPNEACPASHRIVISEAHVGHEPGDVIGLPGAIAERLAARLEQDGQQVVDVVRPTRSGGLEPAMDAFSRHGAPYFLRLVARDLGTEGRPSGIVLLPDRFAPRAGELSATLDDGARGARLDSWQIDLSAADGKPFSPEVAADSARFWESDWGQSMDAAIDTLAGNVLDTVGCRPLVGRVLSTEGRGGSTDLRIDLGRRDGLSAGDRLQVIDPGMPADWLGVNLLTRPDLETTAGPIREPRALGEARVSYLGERDSTLRYQGGHSVESGDLVQVTPGRDRLERVPD
ncbi:hypothetical protein FAZ79_09310 [Guyparkeria sp. SB14A]|uniref:hypothetical protein n=1 Tax=Guyparkeria sp. SB14A TaxID=2571147 RepID=UPI0010AD50FF|nr:hypothetical protein [Guyparkeria sp. SB14A]TKA88654.1 hypothetical protein FAZ79_09310 [Guyparkeria sp. SB14A]